MLKIDIGDFGGFEKAKRKLHIPVVLSRNEVKRVLSYVDKKHWLICALLYGTGMRLSEGLRLRIKDIDFDYKQIIVRDGKGGKIKLPSYPPV